MRVLISRLSALGDVVCSLPAAVAMRRTFPECHITWVVDPRFADVVERCSAVDEVVRCKPAMNLGWLPTFSESLDVAMDLQGLLKSALVVAKAVSSEKIGYHWQREGAQFFSSAVLPDPTSFHIVDQYIDVARAAGANVDTAAFDLAPTGVDIKSVKEKVTGPYVVLNAGAGWESKRWPASSFAELSRLLARNGMRSVLIGGKSPADVAVGDEVLSHGGEVINLIAQTSVGELIALIAGSVANVGGDTGSMHIAAALGKPAVGLYSITNPRRSCPYGQFSRCLYDPAGLDRISVNQVFEKLQETWE